MKEPHPILIEMKYARKAGDQASLVEQIAEDTELYSKWAPLKHLFIVVCNSRVLSDPDSLELMSGSFNVSGKEFVRKVFCS